MHFSATFYQSVYLAVTLASAVSAAPFAGNVKLRSFQTRAVSSGLTVESFHPESFFEVCSTVCNRRSFQPTGFAGPLQTFGVDGVDHLLSKRGDFDIQDATVSFIESKTGFKADGVNFRSSFSSDVTQHAYVRQQIVSPLNITRGCC